MNKFSVWILVVTLSGVDAASLRRQSVHAQDDTSIGIRTTHTSRHLLGESTCTLFRKCITYEATDDHPQAHRKDTWSCKLDGGVARSIHMDYVDIVETPETSALLESAVSGESMLAFSEAIVGTKEGNMFLPENSKVKVYNTEPSKVFLPNESGFEPSNMFIDDNKFAAKQANKPSMIGTKTVLMIRVIDKSDTEPLSSTDELYENIFGEDKLTFKTQINDCSYGKFQVVPYEGETPSQMQIENGFVDVKVNDFEVSLEDFPSKARQAAYQQLGNLDNHPVDLVMYCFPPGLTNKGTAWAYAKNKYSFYSSKWCSANGALMHEVGHNIGLGHSGENGTSSEMTYGDGTGVMGRNPGRDPAKICYNAQKNYQLGWYEDQTDSLYPFDGTNHLYTLNAVSDYGQNTNALISLRLEQKSIVQDFYIGFNQPEGITENISEGKNKVTIISKEKGAPEEYSQSLVVASLIPGRRHIIENFDGVQDIQVRFIGLQNGNAQIEVISDDRPLPPPLSDDCKTFTIEFTTDSHPDKNAWYIRQDSNLGKVVAVSPEYTESKTKRTHEVCLPISEIGETYTFTAVDEKQSNTCSYTILDDQGEVIFSESGSEKFEFKHHIISVAASEEPPEDPSEDPPEDPSEDPPEDPSEDPPEEPECKDDENFLHNDKPGKTCEWIGIQKPKKKEKICKKEPASQKCPLTCETCSSQEDPPEDPPEDPSEDPPEEPECKDDENFLHNDKPGKTCEWIGIQKPKKKEKICKKEPASQNCPVTCETCSS